MARLKNTRRRNTRRNPYDRAGSRPRNAAEVVVFYIERSLGEAFDPPWAALPIFIEAVEQIELGAKYERAGLKPAYESAYKALESAIRILEEEKREYDEDEDEDDGEGIGEDWWEDGEV